MLDGLAHKGQWKWALAGSNDRGREAAATSTGAGPVTLTGFGIFKMAHMRLFLFYSTSSNHCNFLRYLRKICFFLTDVF